MMVWPLTPPDGLSRNQTLFNPDFKYMFAGLSRAKVDLLLVGAYASLAVPWTSRATGDLDIWVCPDAEFSPSRRSIKRDHTCRDFRRLSSSWA